VLPDGKATSPPGLHDEALDERALALLDMDDPEQLIIRASDWSGRG
jgi:hypothetical protein